MSIPRSGWKKQPCTPEEMQQAFRAFDVSDVGCYRYVGTDRQIAERIGIEFCDNIDP